MHRSNRTVDIVLTYLNCHAYSLFVVVFTLVFGKLACTIQYHCAACAISTVSSEWLQDMCTQDYVNTVINLVV